MATVANKKRGPRREFSPAEREAYRERKQAERREQVEASVRELLTSEGWRKWAECRSKFHRYSVGNSMLIAMQMPDATRVAGFRKWLEMDRQVRKGEKAITILAPMTKKIEVEGEDDRRVTFFRGVPVFDVSQTEGEPLPEPPVEPISGDSHERFIEKLEAHAASIGFTVGYEPTGAAGGYCDPIHKRIVVSDALESANARVRVLVHELAHAHGVGYSDYGRADAEVIVETAAVIVCGSLGLDTSGESIPYIAGWGEKDLTAIRRYADTVDEIARAIEKACAIDGLEVVA